MFPYNPFLIISHKSPGFGVKEQIPTPPVRYIHHIIGHVDFHHYFYAFQLILNQSAHFILARMHLLWENKNGVREKPAMILAADEPEVRREHMSYGVMMGFGFGLLIFCFPILALIWMQAKGEKQWFNALIGVCVYFNFYYLIFVLLICTLLGDRVSLISDMLENPWGKAFLIALAGGISCEAGRYVGLRFGTGGQYRVVDAVGLSLGYGFAATITRAADIFSTMTLSSYVMQMFHKGEESYYEQMIANGFSMEEAEALINQLQGITFFDTAMYSIEIVCTLVFSAALSLLVLCSLRKETLIPKYPFLCVWIAVIAHIFTEGVPVVLQGVYELDSRVIAAYFLVLCVGAAFFIRWVLGRYPEEALFAGNISEGETDRTKKKKPVTKGNTSIKEQASRSLRSRGKEE